MKFSESYIGGLFCAFVFGLLFESATGVITYGWIGGLLEFITAHQTLLAGMGAIGGALIIYKGVQDKIYHEKELKTEEYNKKIKQSLKSIRSELLFLGPDIIEIGGNPEYLKNYLVAASNGNPLPFCIDYPIYNENKNMIGEFGEPLSSEIHKVYHRYKFNIQNSFGIPVKCLENWEKPANDSSGNSCLLGEALTDGFRTNRYAIAKVISEITDVLNDIELPNKIIEETHKFDDFMKSLPK